MKGRLKPIFVGVFIILITFIVYIAWNFWYNYYGPKHWQGVKNIENYRQVKTGMTAKQVLKIMGEPQKSYTITAPVLVRDTTQKQRPPRYAYFYNTPPKTLLGPFGIWFDKNWIVLSVEDPE